MHFQYTVFGPLDEFHGFIQICYYECPHISGIYLESLLTTDTLTDLEEKENLIELCTFKNGSAHSLKKSLRVAPGFR